VALRGAVVAACGADVEADAVLGGSGRRPAGTTNMESPPVVELQQPT